MPKYLITGFAKVSDVIEAEDDESAQRVFRAKYPAFLDKEARITVTLMKESQDD